jgi:hypothetical protein
MIIVSLTDTNGASAAGAPVGVPKKPSESESPKGKTTVTEIQSQKTVTEKQ